MLGSIAERSGRAVVTIVSKTGSPVSIRPNADVMMFASKIGRAFSALDHEDDPARSTSMLKVVVVYKSIMQMNDEKSHSL